MCNMLNVGLDGRIEGQKTVKHTQFLLIIVMIAARARKEQYKAYRSIMRTFQKSHLNMLIFGT